jgi:hypothetical protein
MTTANEATSNLTSTTALARLIGLQSFSCSASDKWVEIGTATLLCDIVSSAARTFPRGKRRAAQSYHYRIGRSSTVRLFAGANIGNTAVACSCG